MGEVLGRLDGGELMALAAVVGGVVGGTLIAVVSILAPYWKRVREVEAEAALKRDLLAAGLSPDDIVRVVAATSGGRPAPAARPAVAASSR